MKISIQIEGYDLSDLGIDKIGSFDPFGMPIEWEISDHIDQQIPRWLKTEPVMQLTDDGCVYIRGIYSSALTEERLKAMRS